jgi:hypothetical protein
MTGGNVGGIKPPAQYWRAGDRTRKYPTREEKMHRSDLESGCITTWLGQQMDRELTGGQRLRLAILQDAALSLARKRNQTWDKDCDEFEDALSWVNGRYPSALGCAFDECCFELDYDPGFIRKALQKVAEDTGPQSSRILAIRGKQCRPWRTHKQRLVVNG